MTGSGGRRFWLSASVQSIEPASTGLQVLVSSVSGPVDGAHHGDILAVLVDDLLVGGGAAIAP